MYSEGLASFYQDDVVSEFFLKSRDAFEAAIKGYGAATIGKLLDRRKKAVVSDLFPDAGKIELTVARCEAEKRLAEDLVYRLYSARGYAVEASSPDAPAESCRSRRSSVILAFDGARAVGTVTVGIDSMAGLLVDEVHREHIDRLRESGRRLGEVVRLAVDEKSADSRVVLASLFNAAHGVMVANRLDDVFVEVNPRHVSFYHRALCFNVAGPETTCPRVGAPSVLMRMKVADLTDKIGSLERAIAEFPLG
jgi:hypothetical protein